MDENKQPEIESTNTNVSVNAGGIDFDKLMMANNAVEVVDEPKVGEIKLESVVTEEKSSSIEKMNSILQEMPVEDKVDFSAIEIKEVSNENKDDESSKFEVLDSTINKIKTFDYRKIASISSIISVISIVILLVAYSWTKYLNISDQSVIDPNYSSYVAGINDYQKTISEYTNLNDYYTLSTTSFTDSTAINNLNMVVNSNRLSYVQKKDILQNGVNNLATDIGNNFSKLDNIKKDLTKYGFFPKELNQVFTGGDEDISIKKSLMSLETVKFTTAIKVFSYLDTFIKGMSNIVGIGTDGVVSKMKDLDIRGGKDITMYLNNCYFNPFEIDSQCSLVGDLDNYYKYVETDSNVDINFFKKLVGYIDMKLEQTDTPSFSIIFQKFDPRQKKISFNIEVNTFKDDELSLVRQGVTTPHLFVVTQLFNLLKQSLFVIGENISDNQFAIEPRIIQIGSVSIPVNTSSMTFDLPIQAVPQREITDFVANADYFLGSDVSTGIDTGLVPLGQLISTGDLQSIEISTGDVSLETGNIVNTGATVIGIIN